MPQAYRLQKGVESQSPRSAGAAADPPGPSPEPSGASRTEIQNGSQSGEATGDSMHRISRQPRPAGWSITSCPRRGSSSSAVKPARTSSSTAPAPFPAAALLSTRASSTRPPSPSAPLAKLKAQSLSRSVRSATARSANSQRQVSLSLSPSSTYPREATLASESQRYGAPLPSDTRASSPSQTSFQDRPKRAWSSGPMARKQAWPQTGATRGQSGAAGVDQQKLLDELCGQACAPSPITPATLWEINKAKCVLHLREPPSVAFFTHFKRCIDVKCTAFLLHNGLSCKQYLFEPIVVAISYSMNSWFTKTLVFVFVACDSCL